MHTQALRYMLILIIIASTSCDAATYTVVNGNTYLNVPGGAAYQLFPEGGGVSGFSNSTAAINALKAVLSSNCSGAGGSANGFLETGSSVNPTYQWVSVICTPPIGEALRSYIGAGGVGGTCPGAVFFPMLSSLEFTACGVFVICDTINPVNGQCEPSCQPPKTINPATGQCEPPETYTITLSGGTEAEPSNGSDEKHLPITATVINQNTGQPPTTPVTVRVSLKVDPKTGGHDHGDNTRPRGGIDVTKCETDDTCKIITVGSGGSATITFNAPEASGTHTITATCDGCSDPATKQVNVKVDGLWPIFDSTYYAFIGSTTEHNANHYVTSEAQMQLWLLAQAFYEYQLRNTTAGPTLLHLNDASLKWGGLFDIYADWVPDHYEHRRGSVVDIRANSNPGAIPSDLTRNFKKIAKDFGIDPHLEYDGDPILRHFHTRLLNRKE